MSNHSPEPWRLFSAACGRGVQISMMAQILEDSKVVCAIPEETVSMIMVGDQLLVPDHRQHVFVGSEPCMLRAIVKSRYMRLDDFGRPVRVDITVEKVG